MSAVRARNPKPFVHRGPPVPTAERPTVVDPADPRIPTVYPPRLSPGELKALTREGATDPRLRPVDRCFQRWAVTSVSAAGSPRLASVVLGHISQPQHVPLADQEAKLVDNAVASSPSWAKSFVVLWYRFGFTAQEMADALKMRRRQSVYDERHVVLAYYLGRFAENGIRLPTWEPET